jgi:hypothetical protein
MRSSILPYQGGKWRMRKALAALLADHGMTELESVGLNDIGPWGMTWQVLAIPVQLAGVIDMLKEYAQEPPREVYDRLNHSAVPNERIAYATQHLFLQRISVDGKAVSIRNEHWKSPGYNKNSAEGCAKTDRFGGVRPMVPYLVEVLEEMYARKWIEGTDGWITQGDVRELDPVWRMHRNWPIPFTTEDPEVLPRATYIDPNYVGATGYRDGLTRDEVVQIAVRWHNSGALVLVSESEPIYDLLELGWKCRCIKDADNHGSPFRAKKQEWVTYSVSKELT